MLSGGIEAANKRKRASRRTDNIAGGDFEQPKAGRKGEPRGRGEQAAWKAQSPGEAA